MQQLNFNTNIFIGNEPLDCIKTYSNERICIVTDNYMVTSGLVDLVVNNINDTNAYEIFTDIVPDPTIENVVSGIKSLRNFKATIIVAFGGGSVIDAAKAIKYLGIQLGIISDLILIAIPTTSGTGSEVTNFSVITNKKENLKYPLVDELLQPDKAILDARLVRTVPPTITADTGMDVLTHALEAYVSTSANDFSDALAEKAMELIFAYLDKAYINGLDMEAREKVHYASCLAGIAFNQASLGLCHGIAHSIGGKLHMPHGRINGILLPSIVKLNGQKDERAQRRYGQVAKKLSISISDGQMGVRDLVNRIILLRNQLNMPTTFTQAGFSLSDIKGLENTIAEEALADPTTATNPFQPSIEEIKKLIAGLF